MFGKIWKLLIPHGSIPPGLSPAAGSSPMSGVRHGPTSPLLVARSIGYMYSGASSQRRVPAVDTSRCGPSSWKCPQVNPALGSRTSDGHLLGVQRRHVVVLLERVGEDLPVAVVVRDPLVAFGQLAERVVVQAGDHRAQELAQALTRLVVEVDEDEAVPHIAVHRPQAVFGGVEVEELRFLLHEFQRAVEVVAPAVVLAGELPARPAGLLGRESRSTPACFPGGGRRCRRRGCARRGP